MMNTTASGNRGVVTQLSRTDTQSRRPYRGAMRVILFALACMSAACVSDPSTSPGSPLAAAEAACGAMPKEPGFSVAFGGSAASLSINDWMAVQQFLDDVDTWRNCAAQQ